MKLILVAGARPNFMKIAPLIRQLKAESEKLKVLSRKTNDKRLPCLPRKEERLYWGGKVTANGIYLVNPFGFLDFLNLMMHSTIVMTDSGGIQEETTVLGIPCITLRDTTERPITITQGTNVLVGTDTQKIVDEAFNILKGKGKKGNCPEMWDGKTSERIVSILCENFKV